MKVIGFFAALCAVCVAGVLVLDDVPSSHTVDMWYSIFYIGGIASVGGALLAAAGMVVKSICFHLGFRRMRRERLDYNQKCVVDNWRGSHIEARR